MSMPDDAPTEDDTEDRVSLAPLDPEDALRALLAINPDENGEPVTPKGDPQ